MSAGDAFARVLGEAGEPAPGPRPAGWAGEAMLARLREDVAALRAARSARWALHAGERRAAREAYERACLAAGHIPAGGPPPWLRDEEPVLRIW
jgi:hypothetical protein